MKCIRILLAVAVTSAPVSSQSIDELHFDAMTELRRENWGRAHALLDKAIHIYDSRAPVLFGPEFGRFFYHKGYCELKLRRWADAAESFRQCYERYPNRDVPDNVHCTVNEFHTEALHGWSEAATGLGRDEQALLLTGRYLSALMDEREAAKAQEEKDARLAAGRPE